jgi:hypothetical protein
VDWNHPQPELPPFQPDPNQVANLLLPWLIAALRLD